ncbi:hypothetical protein SAMN05443635_10228 [Roseobacter denitrificans OCh 114]|nr:hypothetical protein SAMN05443635_10228 [Roseobacter denitrificans OCh 114]
MLERESYAKHRKKMSRPDTDEKTFDGLDNAPRKLALWRKDCSTPLVTLLRNALPGLGRIRLLARRQSTRPSVPNVSAI